MKLHKNCKVCGRNGIVGHTVSPYYDSDAGVTWRCNSCQDAVRAKKKPPPRSVGGSRG